VLQRDALVGFPPGFHDVNQTKRSAAISRPVKRLLERTISTIFVARAVHRRRPERGSRHRPSLQTFQPVVTPCTCQTPIAINILHRST